MRGPLAVGFKRCACFGTGAAFLTVGADSTYPWRSCTSRALLWLDCGVGPFLPYKTGLPDFPGPEAAAACVACESPSPRLPVHLRPHTG